MLIILEGPDGSGKTTLAKNICKCANAHYQHMTYRWPKKMPQYHTAAALHNLEKALISGKIAVIDRWWISEVIYAKTHRGGTSWIHYGRMLDRLLMRYGGVYVLCVPSNEVKYKKRFEELVASGREMYTSIDKMLEVRRHYERLIYGTNLAHKYKGYISLLMRSGMAGRKDCFIYDFHTQGDNSENIAEAISSHCQTQWKAQLSPEFFEPTIGNILGDVLVVGDRCNLKWRKNLPEWPFFENANCSLYLAKVMDDLKIPEGRSFFVNMNHPTGVRDIRRWLDLNEGNENKRVMVLGADAEVSFLDNFQGISSYIAAPHPQAARRFPSYRRIFERKLKEVFYG